MECRVSWPGWEVGRCIGKGGFGAVYEIQREVFGDIERNALKVISIPVDEDEVRMLRLEGSDDKSIAAALKDQVGIIVQEYKFMQKLGDNANVVHCNDLRYEKKEDGIGWNIFIRMELLTPLMEALNKVKTERQIIRFAMDICNGLSACHDADLIHRDIKPQNIFVSDKGKFKVGDFGIARVSSKSGRATSNVGTSSYMAPEVQLGEDYDKTVDIYSLGLVVYWLLNDYRGPFLPAPPAVPTFDEAENARRRRYRGETIPAPKHGSAELQRIVLKACAYDPKDRYQSAREMMRDLNELRKSITEGKTLHTAPTTSSKVRSSEEVTVYGDKTEDVTQVTRKEKDNPTHSSNEKKHKEPNGKSKKKRSSLPGILVVVVVLVGAICVLLLFRPQKDDGDELIAAETTEAAMYEEQTGTETEVTEASTHISETISIQVEEPSTAISPEECAHIFEIMNTDDGLKTKCRYCGILASDVNTTTEESSVECEHEFKIQMQGNNLPQYVCTKCGNVDTEQNIPLIYYNKVSDTNSADDGKDILLGDFQKYGSDTIIKNAIKFWVIDAKGYVDTESIDFYLGGSCFFLTGSVIPADKCDPDANMTVRFYGDGTLLEEVNDITASAFSLTPFMIDVCGVQVLRVECTTDSNVFGHCIVEGSLN